MGVLISERSFDAFEKMYRWWLKNKDLKPTVARHNRPPQVDGTLIIGKTNEEMSAFSAPTLGQGMIDVYRLDSKSTTMDIADSGEDRLVYNLAAQTIATNLYVGCSRMYGTNLWIVTWLEC